jgi:hypothetical protein
MGKQLTGCGKADRSTLHAMDTKEHDKVYSRTLRRDVEIGVGIHGTGPDAYGGLVSNNPFESLAQEGFLHAHPEKLGKKGLAEWDATTKGKKLPMKVKK